MHFNCIIVLLTVKNIVKLQDNIQSQLPPELFSTDVELTQ